MSQLAKFLCAANAIYCLNTTQNFFFDRRYLFSVSTLTIAGMCTLALNWVQSANHTLILSSIFESLASISEAVVFCVVVDLFPTHLRYNIFRCLFLKLKMNTILFISEH